MARCPILYGLFPGTATVCAPTMKPATAPTTLPPTFSLPTGWIAALLAIAVALAYLPVLAAGFIWDDDMYVVDNTTLRDLSGLARIWLAPGATPQYYPAVFTSFWVEHHLWGLHAAGYHAVNVACHAAGAILLAVFLGRLAVPRARTTAWIFALHPVQVESVAWITERKNVLSFPLAMLAGLLLLPLLRLEDALRPDEPRDTGRRFSWGRYAAALALFALAVLAKSVVCSLPAVLLIVAWWKRGRIEGRDLLVLGPLFVIGLAAGLHTAHLERGHVGASGDGFAFSWADRILIAGRAVVFYAWCLLWPRGLLFNYPRWTIDPAAAWQWCFPVAVAGVLGATFATRRWLGRGPFAACAAYVGILFPALGFLNVWPFVYSFVADHFQYHASPAMLAVLVASASAAAVRWLPAARQPIAWSAGVAILCGCLGLLTARQATAYRDLETLYRHTLAGNPESFLAINNLADVFIARGELAKAVPLLHESIRLASTESHRTLAQVTLARVEGRLLRGQGALREAIAAFDRGLGLLPGDPTLMLNVAEVRQLLGEHEAAERVYRDLLDAHPRCAPAMVSFGTLLSVVGRTAEAEQMYRHSLTLSPTSRAAYNLAVLLMKAGRAADAQSYAEAAVALDPADPDARELLEMLRGK